MTEGTEVVAADIEMYWLCLIDLMCDVLTVFTAWTEGQRSGLKQPWGGMFPWRSLHSGYGTVQEGEP